MTAERASVTDTLTDNVNGNVTGNVTQRPAAGSH